MPEDIFGNEVQVDDDKKSTETPVISTDVLVGEGKKYATVDELAKAYVNADGFIETLKEENRVLKEQSLKIASLDAALEQLNRAKSSSATADSNGEVEERGNSLDATELAKLVDERLVARETAESTKKNISLADAELKKMFGDKAKEVFDKQASTPELRTTLTTLAKTNPSVFVEYMKNATGYKESENSNVVDGGSTVNTVNLASVNSGRVADAGCKEYYSAMRTKNPALYYSQEMQIKMQNAAINNPTKYFGK